MKFLSFASKARIALAKKTSGKSITASEVGKEEPRPEVDEVVKPVCGSPRHTADIAVTTPSVAVETIVVAGSSRTSSSVPSIPSDLLTSSDSSCKIAGDSSSSESVISDEELSAGVTQPTAATAAQVTPEESPKHAAPEPKLAILKDADPLQAAIKADSKPAVMAKAETKAETKPRLSNAARPVTRPAWKSASDSSSSNNNTSKVVARGAHTGARGASAKPPTAAAGRKASPPPRALPADKGKKPMVETPTARQAKGNEGAKGVVTTGRTGKAPATIKVSSRANHDGSPPSSSSGYSTPCSVHSRRSAASSSGGSKASSAAASVAEELVAQLRRQAAGGHSRGSSEGLPDLKQLLESVDTWAAGGKCDLDLPKVRVPKSTTERGERIRDSARSSLSARSSNSSLIGRPIERQGSGVDTQTLSTLAKLAEVQNLLAPGAAAGGGSAKVLARAVRQLCSPDPGRRQAGITKVVGLFGEEYGLLIATVVLLVAQLQS